MIIGGAEWYRFFGAGERMARLALRGSSYPAVVTATIAVILGLWAAYGLSAAGLIRRLPLLRPALLVIAAVYLTRGLLGVPVVLILTGPYIDELKGRLPFMIVSSLVCIALGACYAAGAAALSNVSGAPTRRRIS